MILIARKAQKKKGGIPVKKLNIGFNKICAMPSLNLKPYGLYEQGQSLAYTYTS